MHFEAHAVDSLDLALDPERARPVVGLEVLDAQSDLRLPGAGPPIAIEDWRGRLHHALPAPIRRSRLRGSICSFIDTASRNSPMNSMTIRMTGKATHHHTPATSAVC